MRAKYDFQSSEAEELNLVAGDTITLISFCCYKLVNVKLFADWRIETMMELLLARKT
jgi:hypothetical protein